MLLWPAGAQETPPQAVPAAEAAAPEPASADTATPDLTLETLGLDIATADWASLVSWVRSLGLPEDGAAAELRQRLYAYYKVQAPPPPEAAKRTIVIEAADRTQYLSATEDSESSILFSGGVALVIKDDERGETITLRADEVRYNPDVGLLSARGTVRFERKGPDGNDWFVGELLDFDLNKQEGLFLDGRSERGSGQDRLTFRADDIVSKGSGVLSFSDGIISSCDDEHPHYSIRASRIWILGGNEWAILNATLSVGEVPVLYLPFFYYPGEEIVFHPVFGYRDREGRYVQTTTYLLGEKPPKAEEISLFKLTESAKGEREVRGLFLRSTGKPAPASSSSMLKIMADLYTGLGAFAGVQAKLDSLGPLSGINLFLGLALSRSLFPLSDGTYSPFAEAGGWTSQWNQSVLLGSKLPIRYALELSAKLKLGLLGLGFSLPLYSDPFFDQDFRDRSEDMAWLKFLKQGDDAQTAPSKRGSFSDRIDVQLAIPGSGLPSWLSTLSLGRLSSQLDWAVKAAKPVPITQPELALYSADPAREFFYPSKLTIVDASLSLGGTLFRWPQAASRAAGKPTAPSASDWPPPEPVAPWAEDESRAGAAPVLADAPGQAAASAAASMPDGLVPSFSPPPLATTSKMPSEAESAATIGWNLNPSARWDALFLDQSWLLPDDIDWRIKYELRSFRAVGGLSLGANFLGGFLDARLNLNGSTQAQWHANASDDAAWVSAADLARWELEDARYRGDKLGATLSLKALPLVSSWLWGASSLAYTLDGTLYDYAFVAMLGGDPVYEGNFFSWDREMVRGHALSASLSARPFGYNQALSLQLSLPPMPETYTGKLDLSFPVGSFALSTRAQRPEGQEDLAWDPLSASLSLSYASWPKLGAGFIWDIEGGKPTSLSARLGWRDLSAELGFRQATKLSFIPGSGWQSTGSELFRPVDLSLSYSRSLKPVPLWKGRLSWSLNTSLIARQSFVRFTDSTLDFTLGLTLKIHEFLDLQFSSSSRNASLWRYYPGLFDLPTGMELEPLNPFLDLAKSLNFFDLDDRRESLFKLKSVSVKAIHYLHDWNLTFELTVRPVFDQASLAYQFRTSVSLLLAWVGVPEFKAAYKKDGDTETWN